MQYCPTSTIATYIVLSKKTADKVINFFRLKPIKTNKASSKFRNMAVKQGYVVIPRSGWCVFKNTETGETVDLREPKDFVQWSKENYSEKDNLTIIEHLNWIEAGWLTKVSKPLLIQNAERIEITYEWPKLVTVDSVKHITINSTFPLEIHVKNHKSVQSIFVFPLSNFDLTFLSQFRRLKELKVDGDQKYFSLSEPNLPFLEEFSMMTTKFLPKVIELRNLVIMKVAIDEDICSFVARQTRLLKLSVYLCDNGMVTPLSSSINSLFWYFKIEVEEMPVFAEHLAKNTSTLSLRELKTNVTMGKGYDFNYSKVKQWEINGLERRKLAGKWKLSIYDSFKQDFPYLERQAEECVVWSSNVEALNSVHEETMKLTLQKKLNEEIEEVPVLKNVKSLAIKYEVTEDQLKLLTKIFPQFTETELKTKVIN